ncbi:MAG: insulinase family protein [Bryobacterales bacterium]|nr:insulinase family protein [Bryobacterales bacterium]
MTTLGLKIRLYRNLYRKSGVAMRITIAALILAAACPARAEAPASAATALPQGVTRITSVEGITEYRLENGLRVLLFPDPTKDSITVNITYLVGSRHESYGETGMAHLLEHLVFKGTPRRPNLAQELGARAARRNGTTLPDRTNYFETFSSTEENLRWALDLEADRMINSFIAKKDLDSEMTVVRNEFERAANNPLQVLDERVLSTAFDFHNYGKPVLGSKADLENVPIDRLQAFYKRYYQPDNAILTVAGRIDEPKTIAMVHEYFGKIPRPERQLPKLYTLDSVQDGERFVAVRRVGDTQWIAVCYHIPNDAHPDIAALRVLAEVLNGPAGRFQKALVQTKKIVGARSAVRHLHDPGLFVASAILRKDNDLEDASNALLDTVEKFADATAEEVDNARRELLKRADLALNNSTELGLTLSGPIGAGDWRLFFLQRDRLRAVTPEDVSRVAQTYLKRSNRTLGHFIPTDKPDRAEIPPPVDVSSALEGYKGGEVVARGEAFNASIPNIRARLVQGDLDNGMKLLLVPKKTRGESVHAQVTLHFGDVQSLKGRSTAAELVEGMLLHGTVKRTRQQIDEQLARLKASITTRRFEEYNPQVLLPPRPLAPSGVRLYIETTRPNLPEVLKLAAEVLKQPSFDPRKFDEVRRAMLAMVDYMRAEPMTIAKMALRRHINPYPKEDPRYIPSFDEEIAALQAATVDDLRKFHSDFYGVAKAELSVVGDFDAESTQVLARELFGSWKSNAKHTRFPRPMQKVDAVNLTFETPDKANAMLTAAMNIPLDDEHPDYPAVVLGMDILGSGGLGNSRLFNRLRQKEGLSYGVRAMYDVTPHQESGFFAGAAIAAPQNIAKAENAFREEVVKALKDGFTEQEIAEAKQSWLNSRAVSRTDDGELAKLLADLAYEDRTLDRVEWLDKSIGALTAQQVVEAMRRHIDPAQLSFFKAGDFRKAAEIRP